MGERGGASWRRRVAVALRDRGHADGREDGSWVVGGDGGAWAEARVGGREHGVAVTVRARVVSPWRAHPCARCIAIARRAHASVVLSTHCCMRARLALGCGTCTQDLQQEKRKKT